MVAHILASWNGVAIMPGMGVKGPASQMHQEQRGVACGGAPTGCN